MSAPYVRWVERRFDAARRHHTSWAYGSGLAALVAVLLFLAVDVAGPVRVPAFRALLFTCAAVATVATTVATYQVIAWSTLLSAILQRRVDHERWSILARDALDFDRKKGTYVPADATGRTRADALAQLAGDLGEPDDAEQLSDLVGASLLYGRGCGYCGAPLAPVRCPECSSMQWGDLAPDHLRPAMPEWHWRAATFVHLFRFDLLKTAAPVVLTTVLLLGAQALLRAEAADTARAAGVAASRDRALRAAETWRASLVRYEQVCRDDRDQRGRDCRATLDAFLKAYMEWSWYAPMALVDVERERCAGTPTGTHVDVCAAIARERGGGRIVDRADQGLHVWMGAVLDHAPGPDGFTRRRSAAKNLYLAGRFAGCVLALGELEPDADPDRYGSCGPMLREPWADDPTLACDDEEYWGCG